MPVGLNAVTLFRAAEAATEKAAKETVQSTGQAFFEGVVAGAVTKGVGSAFRIGDDRNAPPEVRDATIKREGITVALTSICAGGVKLVCSKALERMTSSTSERMRQIAKYLHPKQGAITVGLIAAGSMLAEIISRKIAPRQLWDKNGQLITNANTTPTPIDEPSRPVPPHFLPFVSSNDNNPFKQVHQAAPAAFW